jgi:hypothetical protein
MVEPTDSLLVTIRNVSVPTKNWTLVIQPTASHFTEYTDSSLVCNRYCHIFGVHDYRRGLDWIYWHLIHITRQQALNDLLCSFYNPSARTAQKTCSTAVWICLCTKELTQSLHSNGCTFHISYCDICSIPAKQSWSSPGLHTATSQETALFMRQR